MAERRKFQWHLLYLPKYTTTGAKMQAAKSGKMDHGKRLPARALRVFCGIATANIFLPLLLT